MSPPLDAQINLKKLNDKMRKITEEREALLKQCAAESGWRPCEDCFGGYCSMNCSTAPTYLQVIDYA